MRFFDPDDEPQITQRKLPHWGQAGTVCFITWRTADSMPKDVLEEWLAERSDWLTRHGVQPELPDWRSQLMRLSPQSVDAFHEQFSTRWHDCLEACHGECVLKDAALNQIVADSLMHFDGIRYQMLGFVVMPNHVHLMAVFESNEALLLQCESWKRFTGTKIQKRLGRRGRFWQQDAFDHLVRCEAQYKRLLAYMEQNPAQARLKAGSYALYIPRK